MVSNWDDDADESTQVFENDPAESAAVSSSERWYISADGRTKEVLEARAIIERARAGSLSDSTLVWRDGLSDWTRLDAVPELMQAVRAFRQSSPADRDSASGAADASRQSSNGLAVASLPPLPPVPGSPRSTSPSVPALGSLPAMPAPPGAGARAPTQTLSGAPLPPPPSLPPLPSLPAAARGVKLEGESAAQPSAPTDTSSSVAPAKQAMAAVASSIPAALSEAGKRWSDFAERDFEVPKLGPVKGRVMALVGGGVLGALLAGSLLFSSDNKSVESAPLANSAAGEPETQRAAAEQDKDPTEPPTASNAQASAEAEGDGQEEPSSKGGEPRTVSLDDLKPVEGSEPPTKQESALQSGSSARSGGQSSSSKKSSGKDFDVNAAKSALDAAASKASRCKPAGGPRGTGSVRVKIAPSGKVTSVGLMTKEFQGTSAGSCIQMVFRQATVPPFSGETKTVFKKFTIN